VKNHNNNFIPTCRRKTHSPVGRGANYPQAGFSPEGPNNLEASFRHKSKDASNAPGADFGTQQS
jgi:hypothetical protein